MNLRDLSPLLGQATFRSDVLNYPAVRACVRKVPDNVEIVRFAGTRSTEILPELKKVAATEANGKLPGAFQSLHDFPSGAALFVGPLSENT